MDTKNYIFSDPTGGGEDAVLTLPVWAKPPESISAYTEGELMIFELDGEEEE